MEAKTKKIIFFLGAIFVAIIFLTSYAAFSSNNTRNSSTTTIKSTPQPTIFTTGYSNATITGYGQVAEVRPLNLSNATLNNLDTLMSKLEANGSIDNYVYTNSSYEVYSSSLSPYALQNVVSNSLNSSNSVAVGSTADIVLPPSISLYYSNTSPPISVPLKNRNYTLYLNNVRAIGSNVNLSLSALITQNGLLYNNQLRIALDTNPPAAPKPVTPQTILAVGDTNALITGYVNASYVKLLSANSTTNNTISKLISKLKVEGSINNYLYASNVYAVYNSSMSAYKLQAYLYNALNSSNSVEVGSTTAILLPPSLQLFYFNTNSLVPINVSLAKRNYTLYLGSVKGIGNYINVSLSAHLTQNGTLYNNQLNISAR